MAIPIPHRQLFIDGEWSEPLRGKRLPIINPATEESIGRCSLFFVLPFRLGSLLGYYLSVLIHARIPSTPSILIGVRKRVLLLFVFVKGIFRQPPWRMWNWRLQPPGGRSPGIRVRTGPVPQAPYVPSTSAPSLPRYPRLRIC